MTEVVVAGGTGYIGRLLLERLRASGFAVKAIARRESASKVPAGCRAVIGNVLDAATYQQQISPGSTFVHLVGVPHPAPWKGAQFRAIDLVSMKQSVAAAKQQGAEHFVYMSVAHPAPVMKAYI
jgi:nucleoside-diphosphate-sugar epimerase